MVSGQSLSREVQGRGLLQRGAQVRHARFGVGRIMVVEDDRHCTVRFDDGREISIWEPARHLTALAMETNGSVAGRREPVGPAASPAAPAQPALAFEARWVPVASIRLDQRIYQRPTNEARVKRMAEQWSDARGGAIDVSIREDGSIYCFDGGHRLSARVLRGDPMIYCHVHRYTPRQEAEEFVALQRDRVSVATLYQFKARLAAGDRVAIAVDQIVTEAGFSIDYAGARGPGMLMCVGALETMWRSTWGRRGAPPNPTPERLRAVLSLAANTWGRDREALAHINLRALDSLLARYGHALDQGRFTQRLQGLNPLILRKKAEQQHQLVGMSSHLCLAIEMLKIYNRGLQSNRLPPFSPEEDGASR